MQKQLAGLELKEFRAIVESWGEQGFRAGQVFDWVYKKGVLDFGKMGNLPAPLRSRLAEEFSVSPLSAAELQRSKDGTVKLLLRLSDGNFIEAVAIPAYARAPASPNTPGATVQRLTGCISSQAGCKYGCVFCASGSAGFRRNLTAGEMCGELLFLKDSVPGKELSHVVFMGTGEPLDNYDNVLAAIRLINAPEGFAIGARRITVSTCGLVPGIRRLAGEGLQIELSVSLHAADDATRSRIMPVNRVYPLKELMDSCRDYAAKTGRQVTFEYVLIAGLNSGLQNADRLSKIVRGMTAKVNLIPFNPAVAAAMASGETPARAAVFAFRDRLIKAGVQATVRTPRGQDIDAACGQLRLRHEKA
jgi:23S rRNA (adenine2503-C2)-methyltransferase